MEFWVKKVIIFIRSKTKKKILGKNWEFLEELNNFNHLEFIDEMIKKIELNRVNN